MQSYNVNAKNRMPILKEYDQIFKNHDGSHRSKWNLNLWPNVSRPAMLQCVSDDLTASLMLKSLAECPTEIAIISTYDGSSILS